MMAAEGNRPDPQQDRNGRSAADSIVDSSAMRRPIDGPQATTEIITAVLCGPSAVIILILVAFHGWRPWLLVIAGMLLAWAADALWTVGEHAVRVAVTRRTTTADHPRRAATRRSRTTEGVPHTAPRGTGDQQ